MGELENYEKEQLLKQLKVIWTYHSNAIEGNTLSKGDTSFIIENGLTIQGKSIAEHNQVLGHCKAIDLIYGILDKENIEENDLFLLHKAIQTEIVIDSEKPNGAYKAVPNGRWIERDGKDEHVYYPHPNVMQKLMDMWFKDYAHIAKKISSEKEAVKAYADMHITFASIHPFWDGNGRLARLVANLPLLKNNYLPIVVSNENRQEYIRLLSNYNVHSETLDEKTSKLLENNEHYKKLLVFFESEYTHTKKLLAVLKSSKNKLNGKI